MEWLVATDGRATREMIYSDPDDLILINDRLTGWRRAGERANEQRAPPSDERGPPVFTKTRPRQSSQPLPSLSAVGAVSLGERASGRTGERTNDRPDGRLNGPRRAPAKKVETRINYTRQASELRSRPAVVGVSGLVVCVPVIPPFSG